MLAGAEEIVRSVRPLRRKEYDRMVAMGLFTDERIELIDGLLVSMSPHEPPHAACIDRLTELLGRRDVKPRAARARRRT